MRGILLAGGANTRLWPAAEVVSKQLLNVYDKPMFYYPLSTLMLAGIREVLIISRPEDLPLFRRAVDTGARLGMRIQTTSQDKPGGIAESLIIGEEFLDGSDFALILGDNLFFGPGLGRALSDERELRGGRIFAYRVDDPTPYAVVGLSGSGAVVSLEEKPASPPSHWAVPGLYFYKSDAIGLAKEMPRSARGELEITTVNQVLLKQGRLDVTFLPRGVTWMDMGTVHDLLQASELVRTLQVRQGEVIACLEEIAWRNGWISTESLGHLGLQYANSDYGRYLQRLGQGMRGQSTPS